MLCRCLTAVSRRFRFLFMLFAGLALPLDAAEQDLPRAVDPRLRVTLFAEHPAIVTPTGIDVDWRGRVWALESNTHFAPDGYARHPSDRLHVMRDTDGDGRADEYRVFADGFTHAMSVAARRMADGRSGVYVATRAAIVLLRDDDGDGTCDRRETLVRLETEGNYPHNGLAGFAFDALGHMVFGLGENLGAPYKLIGADGATDAGGGEGGNVYRCRPDGTGLRRLATGFWNPHASCFDAFGRLFTVDNDPDSRPPCRLLHVIDGGDYGYRFRNGRKGLHPFTAWDGEVPGTLPMVAGTGEAPSGIVAYESEGLPADYQGNLLVTSWGDHRIDRFRLRPRGASFSARSEPIVQGGEEFRPVGLAVAPDGSLFCTDWVRRDYKLHGAGRIWKISPAEPPERDVVDVTGINSKTDLERCREWLKSRRLEVRRAAAQALAASDAGRSILAELLLRSDRGEKLPPARVRVEALWALAVTSPESAGSAARELPNWHQAALRGPADEVAAAAQRLVEGRFDPREATPADAPLALAPRQVPRLARELARGRESVDGGLLLAVVQRSRLTDLDSAAPFLAVDDPFLFAAAVQRFAQDMSETAAAGPASETPALDELAPQARLGWLLALRRRDPGRGAGLSSFLRDRDARVRRAAVQWVAEEGLAELRPDVEKILRGGPIDADLLLATLAALQTLDGVAPQDIDKTPPQEYLLRVVRDASRPGDLRALALRLLPVETPGLTLPLLGELLNEKTPELKREALIALSESRLAGRDALLRELASNADVAPAARAEAIAGLGAATSEMEAERNRETLLRLLRTEDAALRRDALRSLRGGLATDETLRETVRRSLPTEQFSEDLAVAWGEPPKDRELSGQGRAGDPEAGRRLFYHARGPGCFKCHTVAGRGSSVGPDLSLIARTMDRRKLAESLLEPSKEIAPQFTNWLFLTEDGRQHSGMIVEENARTVRIGTAEGRVVELPVERIEQRRPQRISVMPAGLVDQMTRREFHDLLAYLETLR